MKTIKSLIIAALLAAAIGVSGIPASGKGRNSEQAKPLSPTGEKLLARYTDMLHALQIQVAQGLPQIDERKKTAFLNAYAAEASAQGSDKPAENAKPEQHAAQQDAMTAAQAVLGDADKFLSSDKLDGLLAKCAVLAGATPRGLAQFAEQGKEEENLVEQLLNDEGLMREMLVADGARAGRYGRAMQIYCDIRKASQRCGKGILHRVALGTSLEQAVPVEHHNASTTVDPVKRYLNYEKAYLNGELDPAFPKMTTWECRMITNCNAPDGELDWGREMLRNYRPDEIFEADYRWRYSKIVKTDVAYRHNEADIEALGTYPNIINAGGVCGRRAFFGRYMLKAFGIPTWGVTQKGHAALSHWTPSGWAINFGAAWKFNWWEDRPGPDFLLETQARRDPESYMKVLRAQWIGDALGEKKVDPKQAGSGGLWNALALFAKKLIVAAAKPVEVALAGEDLAEANESTKAEAVAKAEVTADDKKILFGKDGAITIPAIACSMPQNSTKKILFMKSFSGGMQLHYGRLGDPEPFEYTFEAPHAGKYAIVAQVVTVNLDQHLQVAANEAKDPIDIALPYTAGQWQETKPVEVALVQGKNVLHFTRSAPHYGVTIKEFTLTPAK